MRAAPRKKKPGRLAEEPGPPLDLEQAIEARTDQLFVEAVRAARGPLSAEEARVLAEVAQARPGGLAPDLSWLEAAGVLADGELRALECELRERLPGHAHGYAPSLPPFEPTQAEPGSEEKIKVMRKRYLLKQSLHHPQDKRLAGGIFAADPTAQAEENP